MWEFDTQWNKILREKNKQKKKRDRPENILHASIVGSEAQFLS